MTLGELIEWLQAQDQDLIVKDGFGSPHSDRGSYCDLGFDPKDKSKISDMLKNAKSALGASYFGWKGGEYTMHEYTTVKIGGWGDSGEEITTTHLKYWLLTGVKKMKFCNCGKGGPCGACSKENSNFMGVNKVHYHMQQNDDTWDHSRKLAKKDYPANKCLVCDWEGEMYSMGNYGYSKGVEQVRYANQIMCPECGATRMIK